MPAPIHFPFPALAAQAGRAPLGGTREVALACLMAARLALSARCAAAELNKRAHTDRTHSARSWFASLAIPPAVRTACMRLIDATVAAETLEVGAALAAVLSAARRHLDSAGVEELDRAIASLRAE
ncbi:MAG TPA: hypothetical protein VLD17_06115 [Gemmatimonadaceae bacterium]|nr:hypothetical protein [Gemmatimonadaceae bacterium]